MATPMEQARKWEAEAAARREALRERRPDVRLVGGVRVSFSGSMLYHSVNEGRGRRKWRGDEAETPCMGCKHYCRYVTDVRGELPKGDPYGEHTDNACHAVGTHRNDFSTFNGHSESKCKDFEPIEEAAS